MAAAGPQQPSLASHVDAEIQKFRNMQEQIQNLRGDLQLVLGQQTENEMVQTELKLMAKANDGGDDSDMNVYKKVGPVLIRQSIDDAQQTVAKRLEYITGEVTRIQSQITNVENDMKTTSVKIQKMQSDLQKTTADAINAMKQQHYGGGK